MSSVLINHALENIWSVPDPFNQVILKPNRVTPVNGITLLYSYYWEDIYLPNKTSSFHLYEVGQCNSNLLDLFNANNTWQLISDACNQTNLIVDIYTETGIQLPRTRTWYKITNNNSIIFAIERNDRINFNFNTDGIYIRLYINAFYQRAENANNEQIVVSGGIINSTDDITAIYSAMSLIQNAIHYTGGLYCFINGYKQPIINIANTKIGDVAEFVFDPSVYKVADFKITTLQPFTSILDNVNKVLLHYSGNSDGWIDYIDNIDIFMVDITTQKGVYVHKNNPNTLRNVTYKDYSFVANYLADYYSNFTNSDGSVNIENLYLRLHIRYSGDEYLPILESNQTNYLMKLPDSVIMQTLLSGSGAIPIWQAAQLENSFYTKIMRSNYNDITLDLVEKAYGYTQCNYVLGNNPITVNDGTVTLPPAFQQNATGFEYDINGKLLGFYYIPANSIVYICTNSNCVNVEFIEGIGSNILDEVYDLNPTTISSTNNYRFYIYVLNQNTNTYNWVDVTNKGYNVFTNNVSNWTPATPTGVIKRMSRSDKRFLVYETTLNPTDGLLIHQISYLQNTINGQISTAVSVPVGELDVWLNGYSLVPGIDYLINYPTINIINKVYLNPTPGSQTLTIRFTGFCDSNLQMTPVKETGYVYDGLLSVNNVYNLHEDRVQRIVVGGSMKTYNQVTFVEDTNTGILQNGLPYSIRDVINPLNGLIDIDAYDFYKESLSIEETVSDYMTIKLPQNAVSNLNPISNLYKLYSPFIGKIIYDLINNYLSTADLVEPYSDMYVMQLCEPYQYLLLMDPINPAFTPDTRYCDIQPHWLNTTVSLNLVKFQFITSVVRIYANELIDLNEYVLLDPTLP